MLSRTASELYWMARYLERAESIARVLDVTNKLSMMPIRDSEDQDLQVPLNLTSTGQLYTAAYPDLTMANLVSFLRSTAATTAAFTAVCRWAGTMPTRCAAACPPRFGSALTPPGSR